MRSCGSLRAARTLESRRSDLPGTLTAHVRPFVPDDIPAVVELRRKAFAYSEWRTPQESAAYFERVFFENPWHTGALPSLVHVEDTGRITGFLGIVPRAATLHDEPIRVAVCTQFMVDSENRGLAGVRLVRTLMRGEQDLSFADVANDASRQLWEGLGGAVSPVHSLSWTQPLRPARFAASEFSKNVMVRGLARAMRPGFGLIDRLTTRWSPPPRLDVVPLTPELMSAKIAVVLDDSTLLPEYDVASLYWLRLQLELKGLWGPLAGSALRDGKGLIAGWYLYYMNAGGTGEVVQVAASHDRYRDVLEAMFYDAWRNGLVALRGRGEFGLLPALDPERAHVDRRGPWVLVHSRRPDVMDAIKRGRAFFSRLEGEWWMSF
jgi:hypothetical protein